VTASAQKGDHGAIQVFPKTGEFQISNLPAGRYLLTVGAQDPAAEKVGRRGGQALIGQTVIDVNADVAGLLVVLGSGTRIGIRVQQEESGLGERGAHQARVVLQSEDFPQYRQEVVVPPAPTDVQSPRGFENVAAGTYSVEAWPQGWGYVASLRCAGMDLLKEDLKVGVGTSVPAIDVTLRNDGAELNVGAAANGKPVAGRVIVYSEEYPKRSTAVMTWPTFTAPLLNFPPGTYKLVATRGTRELEYRNPAVMARYLAHATSVTLAPEAKVNLQVEVQDEEPEP
jgi:hypothetical protein